jgi:hypothetical protein
VNTTTPLTLETSISILTIHPDGVGQMHFKDRITLDLVTQKEHLEGIIKITGNVHTPFVVTAGEGVIITKEARDNAIVIEDDSPVNASGIVVSNLAYRMIADFYMKVQKPKQPYKTFTDLNKAFEWCLQFVGKSKR